MLNKSMHKPIITIIALLLITACAPAAPGPEPVACTMDAKICPDGSAVGRIGPDCEFAACPSGSEESTFKEYKATSAETCAVMRFTCDEDEYFSDDGGCGCIRNHNEAAVTLCQADYNPVCGWSDPAKIQCFAYPCAQTYSNLCMASVDPNVASTTPGECPPVGGEPAAEEIECPLERQQACTKEYVPVCGKAVLNTGATQYETYGNKCVACSAMKVTSYTQGACDLGTPQEAQDKYDELASQYGDSLGATLERCANDERVVYVAAGSGGFSGASYYYEPNGNLMGIYEWDDMVIVGEEEPQPPINVAEYRCALLEQTEGSFGKKQATDCTNPRPQACTMQYDPVCGQKDDGSSDTYGNACSACGDSDVLSWVDGEC